MSSEIAEFLSVTVLTTLLSCDPVVQRYRAFFADLDWSVIVERDPTRPWPGSPNRCVMKSR